MLAIISATSALGTVAIPTDRDSLKVKPHIFAPEPHPIIFPTIAIIINTNAKNPIEGKVPKSNCIPIVTKNIGIKKE
jgi:hypothetical protein